MEMKPSKIKTNFNSDGPCHFCTDRKESCHDNCSRYSEWKERLKKVKNQLTHASKWCKTNAYIQTKAGYVEGKYIPVCDAMELMDCCRGKIHLLRQKGILRAVKAGKSKYLVLREDVEKYIKEGGQPRCVKPHSKVDG